MRAWLEHDVPGAEFLRDQVGEETQVFRSCDCGCSSIGFASLTQGRGRGSFIFGVDAEIIDENGASVGGMVLTIRDGQLRDVDVHSWSDEVEFPSVEQVRWQLRTDKSG